MEHIRHHPPDALFIDITMPEMSGLEFIKEMKDLGISSHVVVLSGYAEFAYAQEAIRLGVLDYCLKPVNTDKLIALLEQIKEKGKPIHALPSQQVPHLHHRLKQILFFMNNHFPEKLTIQMLSEEFQISTTYLSKLFAKELNSSFSQYLLDIRMKEAKRLLLETELPVKEIVECCGYVDYAHFHKVFTKYYGMTVSKFRITKAPDTPAPNDRK